MQGRARPLRDSELSLTITYTHGWKAMQMTSAARCLSICEIQRNILRLDVSHGRTAYNLALTCRALSEIALDELWMVIESLGPLLSLFPDDVLAKSTQGKDHFHFVLLRPPWPQDWAAYKKYAPRIHELHVNTSQLCPAELDILDVLSVLQLKPSMTPQLRVLRWSGSDPLYANLFVGPLLRTFALQSPGGGDGDAGAATLANVIHSSPDVEKLDVMYKPGRHTSRILAMLDATSWYKLRSLSLTTETSSEIVPILGRLPVLDTLYIKFEKSTKPPSVESSSPGSLFPRLTLLYVFSADLASIPTQLLFGAGNAPRLADLSVDIDDHIPTATSLQECFATLLSAGNRTALTQLDVRIPAVEPSLDMQDFQATLSTIQPLFALKDLTFLGVGLPFMLDDAGLLVIAKAWPFLNGLHLGGRSQRYHHSDVTLCGLVHFIASVPDLEYLTLNFDATDVAGAWDNYDDVEVECGDLTLWPGGSRILDASAVSKFMDEIMPDVALVKRNEGGWDEHGDPEGFVYRRAWKRVDELRGTSTDSDSESDSEAT